MKHTSIEEHIDNKIFEKISVDGLNLEYIKKDIIDKIIRFSQRDTYLEISKYDLLKDWNNIPIRQKYNTYYVMYSIKRLKGIDWLIKKRKEIECSDIMLFKILKFKEKIS